MHTFEFSTFFVGFSLTHMSRNVANCDESAGINKKVQCSIPNDYHFYLHSVTGPTISEFATLESMQKSCCQ